MSDDEWGPLIEHVPGPCPVPVGTYVETELRNWEDKTTQWAGRITQKLHGHGAWRATHPYGKCKLILRYRVRKPRGMAILREVLKTREVETT